MACETPPTSPSPADSLGCRHQTAAHPGETQRQKREKKLVMVEMLMEETQLSLFLMAAFEQKIRLYPIKGRREKEKKKTI